MSARDHILGAIRRRLGRPVEDAGHADARLGTHPCGPVPAAAGGGHATRVEHFVERALAASAEMERLGQADDLPGLAARLCHEYGHDARIAVAPEPVLTRMDWSEAGLAVAFRAGHADDRVTVSRADCGIAETGTLVLTSGSTRPTTLNFLPDLHIVLLTADSIVGAYEDAWDLLRADGALPRTVNWITGPSRSADIEQHLQLGAHGPVRLVIAFA